MKRIQVCALLGAMVLSSFAMAEGGGDKTFERMMASKEQAVQAYAAKEAKGDPVVLNNAKEHKTEAM
ncbi:MULTISPECIES: co-regulatory protein PtrA N-terminal domain-containing protein [unclassified Pseudomonas]|uniref:co-regulatory protein PtrA N-terminal domain-containing protein n=1 Tax=unclassified Pseudomonas TaxID=196821 RepID=UPI002AC99622|nr:MULTISPECIES: co-regulatory protein PtrA N-terminal domain-containing protein [unclassified Pseudomonas]MEB0046629.1 co-regulatory protein PtrA N-terminal domain-containing protein [Pseudomonas sp. Dout3]MEB0095395.1 co-regulatory protein PtrA N-terminal domain-containing protein [Pseudomonas sp. DC1.2]WPX60978.1 co-regulatory protein PtrA N-terminal domain-containing protein [Pseudomonas sp. DC1.2]